MWSLVALNTIARVLCCSKSKYHTMGLLVDLITMAGIFFTHNMDLYGALKIDFSYVFCCDL